jgi:hypothetical protein
MLTIGKPDEWKDFEKRHRLFFERYGHLRDALNIAFIRPLHGPNHRDLAVFYTGRLAVEDFQEILLLAGNGNGVGALKILRGMYERTVHGRYLSEAPESEVENFYDWHWVQKHKLTGELKKTMGEDFFEELGHGENLEDLEEKYQAVRERFLVKHCDHCSKQKLNHTWSGTSLLDMAVKAGHGIRNLTFEAYYIPTEHIHSSVAAIEHRLTTDETGAVTFKHDVQRAEADLALQYGHLLLLNVLDLQHDYFKLAELTAPLKTCFADYKEIWLHDEHVANPAAV